MPASPGRTRCSVSRLPLGCCGARGARRGFVEVAARHPELARLHDLRTRTSGGIDFVQFHVDLPGDYTVEKAHDIIDRVEQELGLEFPEAELLIHIDPAGHVDEPGNTLVEQDEFAKLESKP